jgi:hypothetical protein
MPLSVLALGVSAPSAAPLLDLIPEPPAPAPEAPSPVAEPQAAAPAAPPPAAPAAPATDPLDLEPIEHPGRGNAPYVVLGLALLGLVGLGWWATQKPASEPGKGGTTATVASVDPAHPLPTPTPTLSPEVVLPAHLSLSTMPPGAKVTLDDRDLGASPLDARELSPGEHQLEVTAPDFLPTKRSVTAAAGETLRMEIALVPKPVSKPVKSSEVEQKATGTLTLDTTPWTNIYLGTKLLGETPLVNYKLPAGVHHLRLVNPNQKIDERVEVTVESGKLTAKRLKLSH